MSVSHTGQLSPESNSAKAVVSWEIPLRSAGHVGRLYISVVPVRASLISIRLIWLTALSMQL